MSSSGAAGAAVGAAVPTESCPFSCVMLLAVHGAVFIDVDEHSLSSLSLESSSLLRPMVLSRIGKEMDVDEECGSGGSTSRSGEIVSLVSPSNLGYSVMISANDNITTHTAAFIKMITPGFSGGSIMDENYFSSKFNSYDTGLYSLSTKISESTLQKIQERVIARTSDVTAVDFRKQFLNSHSPEMVADELIKRNKIIRDALELPWRPHQYAIGNKEYCPGWRANQCCLYFPGVDDHLSELLKARLPDFNSKKRQNTKTRKSSSPFLSLPSLSDNLSFTFDSFHVCVLTITFETDSRDSCINDLWRGVSLQCFFRQINELLYLLFHDVTEFDVKSFMSRTCVLDAACSDFAVRKKGVSIVSFTKEKGGTGRVSALVDVHDRSEERLGFWEYWIRHNPAEAALRAGAGAAGVPRRFNHSVVIPSVLDDFVPACLTCRDLTIQKVEPVFDSHGNVVRVVYTYSDGETEKIDYVPSMPAQPTQSMEAAFGSLSPAAISRRNDFFMGDDDDDDQRSISSPRRDDDDDDGHDGGRRRRLLRRTIKKKCMKKCKTKRMRRRLLRQRCNMSQKNAVKTRGRRTCVRRRL